MIKTQVIGNLGKDAVIHNVNGRTVINFAVASSKEFTNSQGVKTTATTWVSCSYWTEKLRVADYLTKGQQIYVDGEATVDTYRNSQGQTCAQMKLRVDTITLVGKAPESNTGISQTPTASAPIHTENHVDDLPF